MEFTVTEFDPRDAIDPGISGRHPKQTYKISNKTGVTARPQVYEPSDKPSKYYDPGKLTPHK